MLLLMPTQNVSMTDEMYSLVRRLQGEWGYTTFAASFDRLLKLGWAHWSGCLKENKGKEAFNE